MLTNLNDVQQHSHPVQPPRLLIMSSDTPATAAASDVTALASKPATNAATPNNQSNRRPPNNAIQAKDAHDDGAGPTRGRFYHQREARNAWLLAKAIYENAAEEELAKWGTPEQRCLLLGIAAYQTMEIANISRVVGLAAFPSLPCRIDH